MRRLRLHCAVVAAASALIVVAMPNAAAAEEEVTELQKVVLCKNNEEPCVAANRFGELSRISGSQGEGTALPKFLVVGGTVECSQGTFEGKTLSTLAHGELTSLLFENVLGCTLMPGAVACTVTAENAPYLFRGELTSSHTGYEILLTAKTAGMNPRIHISCANGMNCKYSAASVLLATAVEGKKTIVTVSQVFNGEALCAATTATWHAKYILECNEGGAWAACYLRME